MSPIDPAELDRLVDGQLTDPQRRELLARLEREPDGWRRCALAFLEAESWKEVFRATAASAAAPSAIQPQVPPEARPRIAGHPSRWVTVLAMAASFLLAFGLGLLIRGGWPGGGAGVSRPTEVAQNEPVPAAGAPLAKPESPVAIPVGESKPDPRWQMVRIPVGQRDGTMQWVEVPAVAADRAGDAWRSDAPEVLTPEVVRNLQAAGLDVHQSRQLVPVPMEGGGRVVVPVDDVDVQYVGGPAYQ